MSIELKPQKEAMKKVKVTVHHVCPTCMDLHLALPNFKANYAEKKTGQCSYCPRTDRNFPLYGLFEFNVV